jgi:hypothetical protein
MLANGARLNVGLTADHDGVAVDVTPVIGSFEYILPLPRILRRLRIVD